jgi:hypothetical protein
VGALAFPGALLASLLARRARERLVPSSMRAYLRAATVATGALELGLGGWLFVGRFWARQAALEAQMHAAIGQLDAVNIDIVFRPGLAGFMGFAMSPLGLVLLGMSFEGLGRMIAAGVFREARGIVPLWLCELALSALLRLWRRAGDRLRAGPLVEDEVRREEASLVIASCRRRDWTARHAIEFDELLWGVARYEERAAAGARRFVYTLVLLGADTEVSAIHRYAPDELLPRRRSGL